MNIILGSQSPRRRELMAGLDIPFRSITIDADESFPAHLQAGDIPLYISRAKARAYMSELGESHSIKCLLVDGGASNNALLMQMQSDISNIDVLKSANAEATARGAAFLAGLSVGFFRDREDIKQKCAIGAQFSPQMSEDERKRILHGWHKAVNACRQFSSPDNDTI